MTCKTTIIGVERRWLAVCAALAVGEYAGLRLAGFASLWPAAALLAAVAALLGHGFSVRFWWIAATALAGFALALRFAAEFENTVGAAAERCRTEPVEIAVVATEDARLSRGKRRPALYASFACLWGRQDLRVVAELPSDFPECEAPKAGERWNCVGYVQRGRDGHVSSRPMMWVRGKRCSARRLAPPSPVRRAIGKLRSSISRRLGIGLENEREALALSRAILLGDRRGLSPRTKQTFIDSGTIHVFAISGLHVMVIAKTLMFLSAFTFVSIRFSGVLVMPAVWLYVEIAGGQPSAVRAATMATFASAAPLFFRRANWLVAWALAFLLAHILNPFNLVRAGSAFSFVVMLALVLFSRTFEELWKGRLMQSLGVSFLAWAAGVPIAARLFGRIAVSGIVGNVAMVPAAMAATVSALAGVSLSLFSDSAAVWANAAAGVILKAMAFMALVSSRLPFSHFTVERWSLAECAAWYAGLIALMRLASMVAERRRSFVYV